jgi:hypothetical protein
VKYDHNFLFLSGIIAMSILNFRFNYKSKENLIMLRTLSIFMVFGSILFAQIPNGNFEQWTSDGPVEWATPNNPVLPQVVTKSTMLF